MSLSQYGAAAKPAMSEPASNSSFMNSTPFAVETTQPSEGAVLDEKALVKLLALERKRTDRSGRRFILMLLEVERWLNSSRPDTCPLTKLVHALSTSTRETDFKGWYKTGSIFGVIFTEIGDGDAKHIVKVLHSKVTELLWTTFQIDDVNSIRLSFHVYPQDSPKAGDNGCPDLTLYPDQAPDRDPRRTSRVSKRAIDILGSVGGLLLLSPLLLTIAVAVKLTSHGPVLFRQQRLGQYGTTFTFFKFRSMYMANDESIHKNYVMSFISGKQYSDTTRAQVAQVFKIKDDPRITRIGKFLRRSSIDELPQLINVLRGEMSLVGPRPPVPYEVECYELWHKRRLLSVKPGITGLWQVSGRSRVKFDDMVRLDLKYAETWSLWLDMTILLKTPAAVLSGQGAY